MTDQEIKVIRRVQEDYSLSIENFDLVGRGGAETYKFTCGSEAFILKKVPKAFHKTLGDSLKVLQYLTVKGLKVPQVLANRQGQLMTPFDQGFYYLVVYAFIEGREPENIPWGQVGRTLATFHRALGKYEGPLHDHDQDYYIQRYLKLLGTMDYPGHKLKAFQDLGEVLWERVRWLPRGVCHGDLFRGNLLEDPEGQFHLLDWDTVAVGFPIYDLVLLCNGTNYFDFKVEDLKESFKDYQACLEGYTSIRELSLEEINAFYDFVAIYHYQLQATILEVHGLDCIDQDFIDRQWTWLTSLQNYRKKLKSGDLSHEVSIMF